MAESSFKNRNVEFCRGTLPDDELYAEGDVFLFPEKFNGLSLPLQEAFASGMIVMSTDRYPMNQWLPREPLNPDHGSRPNRISQRHRKFLESVVCPEDIAAKIDEWYDQDIAGLSALGGIYNETNSWRALQPRYLELLTSLAVGVSPEVSR